MTPVLFCLAFLAALFVGDRLLALGVTELVRLSDHRLSRIYAGSAGAEVLITGNSVGNAMLIPTSFGKDLGRPSFSIAIHGLDAVTQDAFIADLLERGPPPKIAVMEVRPALAEQLNAPAFSSFQSLSPRLVRLNELEEGRGIHWGRLFRTYRLNSPQLPLIIQKIVDRDDQATGPSNGRITAALKERWASRTQLPAVRPVQLQAFVRSIDRLSRAGCKVVLVMAPLHPAARSDGKWIAVALARIRAAVPRSVPLADFSHLLSDDRYYEDPIHMNKAGRQALESALLRFVASAGRRDEEQRGGRGSPASATAAGL